MNLKEQDLHAGKEAAPGARHRSAEAVVCNLPAHCTIYVIRRGLKPAPPCGYAFMHNRAFTHKRVDMA